MAGVNSRLGGKVLNGQIREIISNVFKFMKKEADNKEVMIPVVRARERTTATNGVSKYVVTKINKELRQLENCKEGDKPTSFVTPNKKQTNATR